MNDSKDGPFFAFLNFFDAHSPYSPPAPHDTVYAQALALDSYSARGHEAANYTQEEIEALEAAYHRSIRYLDGNVAALLDTVEETGVMDETLVIVTSDHGEQFGEHDYLGHRNSLFREEIHVPLMILYPGLEQAGERERRSVSLRDIPVTVSQLIGVDNAFPGRSLLSVHADTVVSELHADWPAEGHNDGGWWSVIADDLHLVWQSGGPGRLFDLGSDPNETTDVRAERPEEYDRLLATLRQRIPPYLAKDRVPSR